MSSETDSGLFTAEDLRALGDYVIERWTAGIDRDWSAPAGTLEWSCGYTADHVVDCVFSYALFLASGKQDDYPNFGEVHALPGAGPADFIEGLRAMTTMLWSVIVTADPDTTAVIRRTPSVAVGRPIDFAGRGGLELILHADDVCSGLGVAFDPPAEMCQRLLRSTSDSPWNHATELTGDAWSDLLARSGRPRPKR